MKRMYIGVAVLAVLLAAGIGLTAAYSALLEPLSAELEQISAAAAAGDWPGAARKLADTGQSWQRSRHFTAAVADHELLEQMDALFFRLEILCAMEEADEFAADCAELSRLSAALAESQKCTWWNLL